MTTTFRVSILTPTGPVYEGPTDYVQAPAPGGGFGVLPRHAMLLTVLEPGIVKISRSDRTTLRFSVDGGIAEVRDNQMTILAGRATPV